MANVSDSILDRLAAWGVPQVYGYPGDGVNGLMGAFESRDDAPRSTLARHEEMAAFMAAAEVRS